MQLYFSPLACSMATQIALYEAELDASYVLVDSKTKLLPDGTRYADVNPMEMVPALRTDDGEVLTENAAILQYVADRRPEAGLAPPPASRARLQEWLSFIGTELHKAIFGPVFDRSAPEAVRAYALGKAPARFARLEQHLARHEYLLDRFSVADAYLTVVLNWTQVTPLQLDAYPSVAAYQARMKARPSVARAMAEEGALYMKTR
jgi:glutathione S-transferase